VEIVFSLLGIAVGIVFAYLCHKIAVGKGRGPILWAVLGFLFPIIALIIILLLPEKNRPAAAEGGA
jgi:hypothetical protein